MAATIRSFHKLSLLGLSALVLVDNLRPGAWLIDLKRVDPAKHDLDGPAYDPHGLLEVKAPTK